MPDLGIDLGNGGTRQRERAQMASDAIAPTMLPAVWPSNTLVAVDRMGRVRRPASMKQDEMPSRASAGTAGASDRDVAYRARLIRDDYERFHPEDTFNDLERRARFCKEDKGVLRDWLALAERRERALIAGAATVIVAE